MGSKKVTSAMPIIWSFDMPGFAEPIQFCFVLGDIPFVDRRLKRAEWDATWKSQFPTGVLPCLEVDGVKYSESRAALMYAATKAKLVPASQEDQTRALMIVGALYEIFSVMKKLTKAGKSFHGGLFSEKKFLAAADVLDQMVSRWQDEEGHCVGKALSYADLAVGALWNMMITHGGEDLANYQGLPHLNKVRAMVYADPRIQEWVRKHPTSFKLLTKEGCWKGQVLKNLLRIAKLNFDIEETIDPIETGFLPMLKFEDTDTSADIMGLHAIVSWINQNTPVVAWHPEMACKMWGMIDMMGSFWENYIETSVDDKDAVIKQIQNLNAMIMREQSIIGSYIGQRFTAADVVIGSFYEYFVNNGNKFEIDPAMMCGFQRAYNFIAQATNFQLMHWKKGPVPELYYYNHSGRAEAIRLAFHLAGMEFKDVRFDHEGLAQYRAESPTGLVPFLKVGDSVYCEAPAILRLVAEWTGLMPSTSHGRAVADTVASVWSEVAIPLQASYGMEKEEKVEFLKEKIHVILDKLEAIITKYRSCECHISEGRFTWIDLSVAGDMTGFFEAEVLNDENKSKWPATMKIRDTVYKHPNVEKYVTSVGPYPPRA